MNALGVVLMIAAYLLIGVAVIRILGSFDTNNEAWGEVSTVAIMVLIWPVVLAAVVMIAAVTLLGHAARRKP